MSIEMQFFINIFAIVSGPIIAVIITLAYQNHKEKRDAKTRLFMTLMAHRKSFPPTIAWVESLNLIDVVFAEHRKVVRLWHEYYDYLHEKTEDYTKREHKYLELLSAMGVALGYKNLQQTDIDKFYTPTAHGDQAVLNHKVQTELLRVLGNTGAFQTSLKEKKEE